MNTSASATSIRHEIVVDAPIEREFSVFTAGFGSFKPPEHNLLGVEIAETVFEPHVGGHVFDRGIDGSVCRWARVLAYEPPDRVLISWDISPQWQIETDHHGWPQMREAVAGPDGWPIYLQRYSDLLGDQS